MSISNSLVHRFPGVREGWSRFDGPAGTQMLDTAIAAMTDWAESGNNANSGGAFSAADACDALLERARATVGALLGTDTDGVVFGATMTTLTLAFSRAVGATLSASDRIVGTRLDHDANVWPWRLAAQAAGAEHVLAPFDPTTGVLAPETVIDLIDERTRWVTLPGASNLIGTVPDLTPIIEAAHAVGARVFVDAVHLAPHRAIDIAALGCDVLVTSPYKWYGPHAGVLCASPALLDELPVAKVRPAPDQGPRRWETGTPNFEGIAAVEAAAAFLLEEGLDSIAATEAATFEPLLTGLQSIPNVTVYGPSGLAGRTPTVAFTVEGRPPSDIAAELASAQIAVWAGHSYAVEVVDQLGVADAGGVVRAGVVRYIEPHDVTALLDNVDRLATHTP